MSLLKEKINEIESKAREVLVDTENKNGEIELPIDLGKILEKNKITLKMGDFDNDIVGAYDRKSKTIYISKSDPYSRKAFTTAHELGHYFLHENKENEVFYRRSIINLNSSNALPSEEQEANWFAASLLMPKESISVYWDRINNIADMARMFGVSYTAMEYRLKNLNLLE